jgi:hypothetical protein
MHRIVFRVPSNGDEISNPSLDELKKLVLHGGEDFWAAGSGDAALAYFEEEEEERKAQLLLMFNEAEGFYLEYKDRDWEYYVPLTKNDFSRKVILYVGGNPIQVPPAFFVNKKVAWSAVEEFCKSGERTPRIEWRKRDDFDWNYSTEEG